VEHLVRFTTAEGRDGHHYATGLDEALKFVERLRNTEATSEVRLYRLQTVPIEFKAYYKVELRVGDAEHSEPDAAPARVAPMPPAAAAVDGAAAPAAASAVPGPSESPDNGNPRRLFTRG
jgi:hypothetical protein